jgi:DNA repair protein RAD50
MYFSVQLKTITVKLKSSEYKDIDERHRVKMIEHQTTLLAVSDLDKYYTALDKALMKFHSIKIADINKIIRELWSLTYKGEDIYNIEIASGEEGTSSNAAKSYNYRVVMSKGNTKMDMRGRCSAGQRVLACLVIRLALAETFCLNCGLMCLVRVPDFGYEQFVFVCRNGTEYI